MEPDRLNDEILSRVEINRRELVRRLVIGTAFAVPMLSSFDMAALTTSSANALTPNQLGFGGGNQTYGAPTITSAAATTFIAGHHGSFDVTATGGPDPSITVAGQLPTGVSLVDTGGGTALLTGTPGASSGGVYALELTAANGLPPSAAQGFKLAVDEAPAITSRASESFAVGLARKPAAHGRRLSGSVDRRHRSAAARPEPCRQRGAGYGDHLRRANEQGHR